MGGGVEKREGPWKGGPGSETHSKKKKKKGEEEEEEEDARRRRPTYSKVPNSSTATGTKGSSSMTGRQFRKVPLVPFLLLLRRLFFTFLFAELHAVVGAYRKWWVFERCNSGSAVVSFQMAVSPWNYERCRVTGEAGGTGVTRRSLFLNLNLLLFCM